jgi:septum formation protein
MLVLASASPRRQELLRQAGLEFTTEIAGIPEDMQPGEDAAAFVLRLAEAKALAVWTRLRGPSSSAPSTSDPNASAPSSPAATETSILGLSPITESVPLARADTDPATSDAEPDPLIVLGADTCVLVNGEILNKPVDVADARRMLELLSGRTHSVMTGIAALTAGESFADVEITQVTFNVIKERELVQYLATGEPLDKAGAYAIQGYAARWIPRIEGCFYNVVGLPIARTLAILAQARAAIGTQRE